MEYGVSVQNIVYVIFGLKNLNTMNHEKFTDANDKDIVLHSKLYAFLLDL